MGKSRDYIRANLVNYTNASCSSEEVKNNRVHYFLKFEEDIGWDWVYSQVKKCAREIDVPLEPYEIGPSGMHAFEIEVREIERRRGIDDSQHGLDAFEEEKEEKQ